MERQPILRESIVKIPWNIINETEYKNLPSQRLIVSVDSLKVAEDTLANVSEGKYIEIYSCVPLSLDFYCSIKYKRYGKVILFVPLEDVDSYCKSLYYAKTCAISSSVFLYNITENIPLYYVIELIERFKYSIADITICLNKMCDTWYTAKLEDYVKKYVKFIKGLDVSFLYTDKEVNNNVWNGR